MFTISDLHGNVIAEADGHDNLVCALRTVRQEGHDHVSITTDGDEIPVSGCES